MAGLLLARATHAAWSHAGRPIDAFCWVQKMWNKTSLVPRPFPAPEPVFAYCKRSKSGAGEGLGTRLERDYAACVHTLKRWPSTLLKHACDSDEMDMSDNPQSPEVETSPGCSKRRKVAYSGAAKYLVWAVRNVQYSSVFLATKPLAVATRA